MKLEMTRRVPRDRRRTPLIAVHAQRDLLRHRSTRKERRGLDLQQAGKAQLELLNDHSFAIRIGASIRVQSIRSPQ
jgi:hypothetical protein